MGRGERRTRYTCLRCARQIKSNTNPIAVPTMPQSVRDGMEIVALFPNTLNVMESEVWVLTESVTVITEV